MRLRRQKQGPLRMLVSATLVAVLLQLAPVTARPADQQEDLPAKPLNSDYQALQALLGQNLAGTPQEKAKVVDLMLQLLSEIDLPTLCDVIASDTNGSFRDFLQAPSKSLQQPLDSALTEMNSPVDTDLQEVAVTLAPAQNHDDARGQPTPLGNVLLSTDAERNLIQAIPYSNSQDSGHVQGLTAAEKPLPTNNLYIQQEPNVAQHATNKSGFEEANFSELSAVSLDMFPSISAVPEKTETLNDNYGPKLAADSELFYHFLSKHKDYSPANTKLDPAQSARQLKQTHLRSLFRPEDYTDNFETGNSVDGAKENEKKSVENERPISQLYAKSLLLGDWLNEKNTLYVDMGDYKESNIYGEKNLQNSVLVNGNTERGFTPLDNNKLTTNSLEKLLAGMDSGTDNYENNVDDWKEWAQDKYRGKAGWDNTKNNMNQQRNDLEEALLREIYKPEYGQTSLGVVSVNKQETDGREQLGSHPEDDTKVRKILDAVKDSIRGVDLGASGASREQGKEIPEAQYDLYRNRKFNEEQLWTPFPLVKFDPLKYELLQAPAGMGMVQQITSNEKTPNESTVVETSNEKTPKENTADETSNVKTPKENTADETSYSSAVRKSPNVLHNDNLVSASHDITQYGGNVVLTNDSTARYDAEVVLTNDSTARYGAEVVLTNDSTARYDAEVVSKNDSTAGYGGEVVSNNESTARFGEQIVTTNVDTAQFGEQTVSTSDASMVQKDGQDVETKDSTASNRELFTTANVSTNTLGQRYMADDVNATSHENVSTDHLSSSSALHTSKYKLTENIHLEVHTELIIPSNLSMQEINLSRQTVNHSTQKVNLSPSTQEANDTMLPEKAQIRDNGTVMLSGGSKEHKTTPLVIRPETSSYGLDLFSNNESQHEPSVMSTLIDAKIPSVAYAAINGPTQDTQGEDLKSVIRPDKIGVIRILDADVVNETTLETTEAHSTAISHGLPNITPNTGTTITDSTSPDISSKRVSSPVARQATGSELTESVNTTYSDGLDINNVTIKSQNNEQTISGFRQTLGGALDLTRKVPLADQNESPNVTTSERSSSDQWFSANISLNADAKHGDFQEQNADKVATYSGRSSNTSVNVAEAGVDLPINSQDSLLSRAEDKYFAERTTTESNVGAASAVTNTPKPTNQSNYVMKMTSPLEALDIEHTLDGGPTRNTDVTASFSQSERSSSDKVADVTSDITAVSEGGQGYDGHRSNRPIPTETVTASINSLLLSPGLSSSTRSIIPTETVTASNNSLLLSPGPSSSTRSIKQNMTAGESSGLLVNLADVDEPTIHLDKVIELPSSDNGTGSEHNKVADTSVTTNTNHSLTETSSHQDLLLLSKERVQTNIVAFNEAEKQMKEPRAQGMNQLNKPDLAVVDSSQGAASAADLRDGQETIEVKDVVNIKSTGPVIVNISTESVEVNRSTEPVVVNISTGPVVVNRQPAGDSLIRHVPNTDVTLDRLQKVTSMLAVAKLNLSEVNLSLQNKLKRKLQKDNQNYAINLPTEESLGESNDNVIFKEIHLSTFGPETNDRSTFQILDEDVINPVITYRNVPYDSARPSDAVSAYEVQFGTAGQTISGTGVHRSGYTIGASLPSLTTQSFVAASVEKSAFFGHSSHRSRVTSTSSTIDLSNKTDEASTSNILDLSNKTNEASTSNILDLSNKTDEASTSNILDLSNKTDEASTSNILDLSNKTDEASTSSILDIANKANETSTTIDVSNKSNETSTPINISNKVDETSTPIDVSNKANETSTPIDVSNKANETSTPIDVSNKVNETPTPIDVSNKSNETSTSIDVSNKVDETSTPINVSNKVDETSTPIDVSNKVDETSKPIDVSNKVDETSTPIDVSNKANETSTPIDVSNKVDETSTPIDVSNKVDETFTPIDVSNKANETSTPIDVSNKANETSTPIDVSNKVNETSTPINVSNKSNETSTSIDVSNKSNETSTSIDVSNKSNETSTSIHVSNKSNETSTPIYVSNTANETSISIDISNKVNETSTPIEVSNKVDETSMPIHVSNKTNETSSSITLNIFRDAGETSTSSVLDLFPKSAEISTSNLLQLSRKPDEISTSSVLEKSPKTDEISTSSTLELFPQADEVPSSTSKDVSNEIRITQAPKKTFSDKSSKPLRSSTKGDVGDQYYRAASKDRDISLVKYVPSSRRKSQLYDSNSNNYEYVTSTVNEKPQSIPYSSGFNNWLVEERHQPQPTTFIHPWKAYNIGLGMNKVKQYSQRNGEKIHSPQTQQYSDSGLSSEQRESQNKEYLWKARPWPEKNIRFQNKNMLSDKKASKGYGRSQSKYVDFGIDLDHEKEFLNRKYALNSLASRQENGNMWFNRFNLNDDDFRQDRRFPLLEESPRYTPVESSHWTASHAQDSHNVDVDSWDYGNDDSSQILKNKHLDFRPTGSFSSEGGFDPKDYTRYKGASKENAVHTDNEDGKKRLSTHRKSTVVTGESDNHLENNFDTREVNEASSGWMSVLTHNVAASAQGVLAPKGFHCPNLFGHHRDPENCQAFFICSWGMPHRIFCPPGTLYSPKLGVCDWAYNVNCLNSQYKQTRAF